MRDEPPSRILGSRFHGNDNPFDVIPAKAGIQTGGIRQSVVSGYNEGGS